MYVEQYLSVLPSASCCHRLLDVSSFIRNHTEQLKIILLGISSVGSQHLSSAKTSLWVLCTWASLLYNKVLFFYSLSFDTLTYDKWGASWLNRSSEGWQLQHPLMITLVHDWHLLSSSLSGTHHELHPRKKSQPLMSKALVHYLAIFGWDSSFPY